MRLIDSEHLLTFRSQEAASKPLDVTLRLLLETMRQSSVRRFLVDGYPCTVDQIQAFEAVVVPIDLVLMLDYPEVGSGYVTGF
jgi:adenylate kinase family enzyme